MIFMEEKLPKSLTVLFTMKKIKNKLQAIKEIMGMIKDILVLTFTQLFIGEL